MKESTETRVKAVIARYFNLPPSKVGLDAELFIRRMREAGGVLRVGINDAEGRGRAAFGDHPHSLELDQQDKLAEFFEAKTP